MTIQAALEVVEGTGPFGDEFPQCSSIFDKRPKEDHPRTEMLDDIVGCEWSESELRQFVQCNEHQLLQKFPTYTQTIRAFNEELNKCQRKHTPFLATLNMERLHQLLASHQVSEHCPAPLLESNALITWILQSIPFHWRRLIKRIFAWLLWANRPLNIDELSAALHIGWDIPPDLELPGSTENSVFISLQEPIAELTRGLVAVRSDGIVGFVHGCVREHLISHLLRKD